jgi:diacylglycerol O-acyltransferase / wax synthase
MSVVSHAERLTALDAGFLIAETATTPMHIGALMTIERAPFVDGSGKVQLDRIRGHVMDRIHLVPRMRQVLRDVPFSAGRPVWVDDPDFEIEHHVRLLEVPAPGDDAALVALTEELSMTLLDRTRPLWEWWVIDGLDDNGVEGGRLALFEKMHHCIVDGVGGVEILAAFTDLAPDTVNSSDTTPAAPVAPRRPIVTEPWTARPAPSGARLLAAAAVENVREPWQIGRVALHVAGTGVRGVKRVTGSVATLAGMVRPSARAPSLSLNRRVGRHRRLRSLTLDLDEIREVAHAHQTKVNDVVLSIAAGGFRALLVHRGEPVTGQVIHALVPENIRPRLDDPSPQASGNHITGFFIPLPVDRTDAEDIVHNITAASRRERRDHADDKAADLLSAADHAPYALVRNLGSLINSQPWVNTIVTNVPGPRQMLMLDQARVLSIAPLVPLSGNITIAIAALSYRDDITLTVNACREGCPDLDVMIEGMRATAAELTGPDVSRRPDARPPRG